MRLQLRATRAPWGRLWMSVLATVIAISGTIGLRPTQSASAYNLEGWHWNNPDVLYIGDYGNGVPGYAQDAMSSATSGWNAATAFTIAYERRSDTSAEIIFVPYWQNSCSIQNCNWTAVGGCTRWDTSTGICSRGEVDINLDPNNRYSSIWACNCPDIKSFQIAELGQELGHVFGLAHSCVDWQWMTGPNPACSDGGHYDECSSTCPTSPQQDDVDGVSALYPGGNSNDSGGGGCAAAQPPIPTPTLQTSVLATVPPIPHTPSPLPHPTATIPPNAYTSNVFYAAGQTRQNPTYPVQQGRAVVDNEKARGNGLWPSGQHVSVPGGPDVTVPAESRPC